MVPQCAKRFKTTGELKRHLITHKAEEERRTFPCVECDKTFKTAHGLKCHSMGAHMPEEEYPHLCPYCGKKVVLTDGFTRHVRGAYRREAVPIHTMQPEIQKQRSTANTPAQSK